MGVKEKVLTAVDSIASGDFLRVVTSAGYARKIDYNKLAKAIVENYAGSSLAGSSQSLKAAIDSLNSKWTFDTVTDWNDFTPPASPRSVVFGVSVGSSAQNEPFSDTNTTFIGIAFGVKTYCNQFVFSQYAGTSSNYGRMFTRVRINGTWGIWKEIPIIS